MEITKYIPQRPPMVMIDEILVSDENKTQTQFTVKADNIFIENGNFATPGLIENMAQTAAARAGHYFVTNNEPVKLGFIGGIKKLKIEENPPIGAVLKTEIIELGNIMGISSIKATVNFEEREIASCELKIFIQDAES